MKINLDIRKHGEVIAYRKNWHGTVTSINITPKLRADFTLSYYDDITREQLEIMKATARGIIHDYMLKLAEDDNTDYDFGEVSAGFCIRDVRIWVQII